MAGTDLKRPTDAELTLLQMLWKRGPSTVRELHDAIAASDPDRAVGYTTALKLLQIMTVKGLVLRVLAGRQHIYRAARPAGQTQKQLVKDLLRRAFDNSAASLVLQALSVRPSSPDELKEIRQLINKLEMEGR